MLFRHKHRYTINAGDYIGYATGDIRQCKCGKKIYLQTVTIETIDPTKSYRKRFSKRTGVSFESMEEAEPYIPLNQRTPYDHHR
jgi:hypothetical protein